MDNDEDDDGNFTKWMSSYWGHSTGEERAKEQRRSFRRPCLHTHQHRRASLPCQRYIRGPLDNHSSRSFPTHAAVAPENESQLNAMRLNPPHVANTATLPTHAKSLDKTEVKSHPRARHSSDDDNNSHIKSPTLNSRITTIHELSESFERQLRFRSRNIMSLNNTDDLCLICHDESRSNGAGRRETHCTHRSHREGRRPEGRPCGSGSSSGGGSTALACDGQKSGGVPACVEHKHEEQPRRKLSLRRQR
ncbi:hypothetical protein AAFF_G00008070 [Aldrovandia affinis]|uniref:Leukemia NUP98 fusion partner 1 n=1 Tax=Aldrovandia affinis TaxID=143900 RepID=A0AAD7X0P0_9TELE|nr:hypothetical protein AAFF_G00008070 [Aldrovandia affinis]